MSLGPLLSAPPPIPWHAFAAFAALAIGGAQLALPKGTTRHRVMGYAWAGLMLVIAISSFWIQQIRLVGPFSPIHILSIIVLITVPLAVWDAHIQTSQGHDFALRFRVDRRRRVHAAAGAHHACGRVRPVTRF